MSYSLNSIRTVILDQLRQDWVPEQEVYSLVYEICAPLDQELLRDFAFGVITGMVLDDLVDIGDISSGDFVPWGGQRTEVILRAYAAWRSFPALGFGAGDAFWISESVPPRGISADM